MPKNDQIWPEIGIFARPCRLIWCPVCGLVGGCGVRAVSRKTPIYFMYMKFDGPVESHQVYAPVVRPLLGCSQLFVVLFLPVVVD